MTSTVSKIVNKKALSLAERWRRALACHGEDITRAEIDFDLGIILRSISKKENYYDLSCEEARLLYPILLKMKEQVFNYKRGINKKQCSFRFSEDARMKLDHLAEKGGTNRTVVLEMLIRKAFRFEIEVPSES